MLYEFQVLYRFRVGATFLGGEGTKGTEGTDEGETNRQSPMAKGVAVGGVETVVVRAETAGEARDLVAGDPGLAVMGVGPGRPLVDWEQPTWTLEEAEHFLKCAGRTVREFAGMDLLPRARVGRPVFRRRELEALLDDRMEGGLLKRAAKAA